MWHWVRSTGCWTLCTTSRFACYGSKHLGKCTELLSHTQVCMYLILYIYMWNKPINKSIDKHILYIYIYTLYIYICVCVCMIMYVFSERTSLLWLRTFCGLEVAWKTMGLSWKNFDVWSKLPRWSRYVPTLVRQFPQFSWSHLIRTEL